MAQSLGLYFKTDIMDKKEEVNKNKNEEVNKNIDVTRTQRRETLEDANMTGEEQRPEGAEYEGNPEHHHGSHREGEYPRQSDDPTMHPSGKDEEQ
jgi:hypothetical protein